MTLGMKMLENSRNHICLQNSFRKDGGSRAFLTPRRPLRELFASDRHARKRPKNGRRDAVRALRLFQNEKNPRVFDCRKRTKSGFRRATAAPLPRNGVLVGLQRGCRCRAIAAPLQPRGALTGNPSSPFGGVRGGHPFVSDCIIARCKNSDFSVEKRP